MSEQAVVSASRQSTAPELSTKGQPMLQRKCACGQHTTGGGECEECRKKRLRLQRRPTSARRVTSDPSARASTAARATGEIHSRDVLGRIPVRTLSSPAPVRSGELWDRSPARLEPLVQPGGLGGATSPVRTGYETSSPADRTRSAGAADAEGSPESATPTPEPSGASAQLARSADETEEPTLPEQGGSPSLLVEDDASALAEGQLRKADFLDQLKTVVCAEAEAALANTGQSTEGCPYLAYWFDYYRGQSASHVEAALHRYAPETLSARTAAEYIPLAAARVRKGVEHWVSTGEVTGVPEGAPRPDTATAPAAESQPLALQQDADEDRKARDPRAVLARLGPGRPLESGVRKRMERAFDRSFGRVRIHTEAAAERMSREEHARAFTVGEHVAFRQGEYRPGTIVGDALIAHELAHTMQQEGSSATETGRAGGDRYELLEADADRSARTVMTALYGHARHTFATVSDNALPSLKSGLRLSRCKDESTPSPTSTAPPSSTPCAPTLKSLKATKTGTIAMTTAWSGACEMAFGSPSAAGMTIESEVDAPAGCTGKLEFVQLVDSCRTRKDSAGNDRRIKTSGYWLDTQDPYAGQSKSVTTAGTVKFSVNDSPGTRVGSNTFLFNTDKFKTWLLWTPGAPSGSPRVALGVVEWNWSAKATKTGTTGCASAWTLSDASANGGTGSATSTLPTWSKKVPTDLTDEAGTCP